MLSVGLRAMLSASAPFLCKFRLEPRLLTHVRRACELQLSAGGRALCLGPPLPFDLDITPAAQGCEGCVALGGHLPPQLEELSHDLGISDEENTKWTQWHLKALSGTQWRAVARSGTQWHSGTLRVSGTQ